MSIIVEPFTSEQVPAVRDFNKRMRDRSTGYGLLESPVPRWLPRIDSIPLYRECFVALEGNAVRGGYILRQQAFDCNGKTMMIAGYQLPISEGIVNRQYALVGLLLLKDALKRQPLLYGLGTDVRLFKAMKWRTVSCPFYFRINHPFQFFRKIVYLRRKWSTKIMLDILAYSGVGWFVVKSLQVINRMRRQVATDVTGEVAESFSTWADDIWYRAKHLYSMIAVRDSTILNRLYPSTSKRFIRIKVLRRGEVIGWAVMLDTKMDGHKYFGQMRVGSVIDCLAVEGEELSVVAMATQLLERWKVDLIITNQLHDSWCKAFSSNGYVRGPSNFTFTYSPQLSEWLHPIEASHSKVHMTRGDGDGPLTL